MSGSLEPGGLPLSLKPSNELEVPPQSSYAAQKRSLSPRSSPFQATPEPYGSDQGYSDLSNYTTPMFDDELLDFGEILNLEEDNGDAAVETTASGVAQPAQHPVAHAKFATDDSDRVDTHQIHNVSDAERADQTIFTKSIETVASTESAVQPANGPNGTAIRHSEFIDGCEEQGADIMHFRQQGVDPAKRAELNEVEIPSLKEQEKQRHIDETKAEVARWLTRSSADSRAEDVIGSNKAPTWPSSRQTDPGKDATGLTEEGLGISKDEAAEAVDGSPKELVASPPAHVTDITRAWATSHRESAQDLPDCKKPWVDSPQEVDSSSIKGQPSDSNAAIARFNQRADALETASIAATMGTRRRSLDSLFSAAGFSAAGISVRIPTSKDEEESSNVNRRISLLDKVRKRSNSSNKNKRKGPNEVPEPVSIERTRKESQNNLSTSLKVGNWRPKSPRLDTDVSHVKADSGSTHNNSLSPSGPWSQVTNALRRTRSRSEIDKPSFLASHWAQQGGPPVPTLRSPSNEPEGYHHSAKPIRIDSDEDESDKDAEGEDDGLAGVPSSIALKAQHVPPSPTLDGFKEHVLQLCPRLPAYMVERITQEQLRRYKKLVEFRVSHANMVSQGRCSAGDTCATLGGGPKPFVPKGSGKNSETQAVGFRIKANGSSDESGDRGDENMASAQFPPGVPLPPVQQLPASFECPICFEVKNISKPSDWTKHVHEDVQPFTCTFPNCGEPKSFKRKADWVRHENERHRQLEKWVCNYADCGHVCYRKDNFNQHLFREHKLPEPRGRGSKTTKGPLLAAGPSEDVNVLQQTCHYDTTRTPRDEPCRFCGFICISWKKLTVHLAKHLEQISMPVLTLVAQAPVTKDTIVSPIDERLLGMSRHGVTSPSASRGTPSTRSVSPGGPMHSGQNVQNNTQGYQQSPNAMGNNMVNSQSMHTYPPPSINTFAQHRFKAPIDVNTVPPNFAAYWYSGFSNAQATSHPATEPPQNLLSPMDGSANSYASSVSSTNHYFEPTQQPYHGYPEDVPNNATTVAEQPVFQSPVDNTYSFAYGNPQDFNNHNGNTSYPQYPVHAEEYSQQTMYQQDHSRYSRQHEQEQDLQSPQGQLFQGSTYPPQIQRSPRHSPVPPATTAYNAPSLYTAQGNYYGQ